LGMTLSGTSQLAGIIPLMFVNSPLTGKRVVSLPFTAYCTPLVAEEYIEEAVRFAYNRFPKVSYVELKFLESTKGDEGQLGVASSYVDHIISLKGDIDELFRSFHYSCVRKRVRHANKKGLTFSLGESESHLRQIYKLIVKVRRSHGLPPQPYELYYNIYRILLPLNLLIMPLVEFNGNIIAGGFVLKSKHIWHLEYSASDHRLLDLAPNPMLFWECIKMAHQAGANYFDLGRTSIWNNSLLEFKDRWQAKRHVIRNLYFPQNAKAPAMKKNREILLSMNKRLPATLLKWIGRVLYPHMG